MVEIFQFFLPAGEIFNPILDGVLKSMVWVESEKLIEIALYSQTTQLVEYIRTRPDFNGTIRITGQSLGGGISLITVGCFFLSNPRVALRHCCSSVHGFTGCSNQYSGDCHIRYV
jgi:hypothetical protein